MRTRPEAVVRAEQEMRDSYFPNNTLVCRRCYVSVEPQHRINHAKYHNNVDEAIWDAQNEGFIL